MEETTTKKQASDAESISDKNYNRIEPNEIEEITKEPIQKGQAEIEEEIIPIDEPIQNYKEQFNNNNDNGIFNQEPQAFAFTVTCFGQ